MASAPNRHDERELIDQLADEVDQPYEAGHIRSLSACENRQFVPRRPLKPAARSRQSIGPAGGRLFCSTRGVNVIFMHVIFMPAKANSPNSCLTSDPVKQEPPSKTNRPTGRLNSATAPGPQVLASGLRSPSRAATSSIPKARSGWRNTERPDLNRSKHARCFRSFRQ